MTGVRVTLVLDPFGIWSQPAQAVRDVQDELQAFRHIEELLCRDERFETVTPKTFLVHSQCWGHFQSYRAVRGVAFHEVTPRRELASRLRSMTPDWLTDQQILDWGLLERPISSNAEPHAEWPAVIVEWLAPGLTGANDLADWLSRVASSDIPPSVKDCLPVMQQLHASFLEAAERSSIPKEIAKQLGADLEYHQNPAFFARDWLRYRGLLPVMGISSRNPLRAPGITIGSTQQRALAKYIPLVFPLPNPLHAEVSEIMRRAVHSARIQNAAAFEAVALRLEACWTGLAEELRIWIAMQPRAMSQAAADHLQRLLGFEMNDGMRRMVQEYAPPPRAPVWPGLEDESAFDGWIASYARFLRSSFLRRDVLRGEEDPAEGFGRWLKDHETVSFAHPQRSYSVVARRVQQALKQGRAVILVLMDALAIHVASALTDYVSDRFGAEPSWSSHLFAPVPTITSVCKEAVLTGRTPDQACGNLRTALLRAYRLEPSELLVSASWQDAERTALQSTTRLLVHRDNRLDDRLCETASYASLLEDCAGLFARAAALLSRWVDDFRCLHQSPPVVLVTADHGFTYGPPPDPYADRAPAKGPASRCIELGGAVGESGVDDPSLTVLDRNKFHLPKDFLAARGRRFGSDTTTGWTLAHGGLLPEEVVIPVLEWFGDAGTVCWPNVEFPEGAQYDRTGWLVPLLLSNPHSRRLNGGTLAIGIAGSGRREECRFPALDAGGTYRLDMQMTGDNLPDGEKLCIDVTFKIHAARGQSELTQDRQYLVERAKRLMERTVEQDEFEAMF